jgi:catechol 2,3-dioxygenase-like lactoylglutathione lyase family enzyme
MVRTIGIDHYVLHVADVERSLSWYQQHLGLEPLRVEEWRRGEAPFASLRIDATTIIDLFAAPRTGENVNHVALVVAPDTDLAALAASGELGVVDGPGERWGAQGIGYSIYVTDPDGNVVELRTYGSR